MLGESMDLYLCALPDPGTLHTVGAKSQQVVSLPQEGKVLCFINTECVRQNTREIHQLSCFYAQFSGCTQSQVHHPLLGNRSSLPDGNSSLNTDSAAPRTRLGPSALWI